MGHTQQKAFEDIKNKLLEDIIIQFPDFTNVFHLNTDGLNTHVVTEVYQVNETGHHQSLGFASETLNSAERNYNTIELELSAVEFACKNFRNYLLRHQIKLLTDHHSLTFLNTCQIESSRLVRWVTFLARISITNHTHIRQRKHRGRHINSHQQAPKNDTQANREIGRILRTLL